MQISSDKEVLKLYKNSADSYNNMMDEEINLPVYAEILGRLANQITDLKGPVVDTSCGSGHMLHLYHQKYDPIRSLVGIDMSPHMVKIAVKKLGKSANIYVSDMRDLCGISNASCAAVISFFAIHHLDSEDIKLSLREWHRVLEKKGQFVLGAWEGTGLIDYGDASDLVAYNYPRSDLLMWTAESGFLVNRSKVELVEDLQMNAIYLEATKKELPASK